MKKTLIGVLLLIFILLFFNNAFAEMTPEYKKALLKQMHKSEVNYEFNEEEIDELKIKLDKTQKEINNLAKKETNKIKDDNTLSNWKSQLLAEGVIDFDEFRDEVFDEMIAYEQQQIDELEADKIVIDASDITEESKRELDKMHKEHKKYNEKRIKKIEKLQKESSKW